MINPVRLAFALVLLATAAAPAQYQRVNVAVGPNGGDGTLHLYLFDSRRSSFKVIDQGGIEKQAYANLGAALKAHKCVAGCNGGFFGKDGNPLGLVIADGKVSGRKNLGSSLCSGVLYLDGSRPRIQHAVTYFNNGNTQPRQLLQAGPLLVENGKPVEDLSSRRTSRRSFVLTDGNNLWAIGYSPATTLQKLAAALADAKSFKNFKVMTALNLDGGSSSGFWVHREHGPLYLKEINRVRNFIGLVRR